MTAKNSTTLLGQETHLTVWPTLGVFKPFIKCATACQPQCKKWPSDQIYHPR